MKVIQRIQILMIAVFQETVFQSVVVVPKNSTLTMEETSPVLLRAVRVTDTILITGKMRLSQGDIHTGKNLRV